MTRLALSDVFAATDRVDVGRLSRMFAVGTVRGSFAVLMLVLAAACSVVNKEHCGNQDGNATCRERDPNTPYCSICISDNDGCLAEDPGGSCLAETAAPTGAGSSESGQAPTSGTSAPATSGETTTGAPDTSTSATTTGTGEQTTTTTDATTTDATSTTSTATTTDATGSDTTDTGGPVCGNNKVEGDEVCDGTDLNGQSCAELLPDKWGGGKLTCNDCSSYNDTQCCIGVGQECSLVDPDGACCDGLTCKMDDLLMVRCLN